MKDPRIAELELLAELERCELLRFDVRVSDPTGHYGLSARAFSEMLFALLNEGALNGEARVVGYPLDSISDDPRESVRKQIHLDLNFFLNTNTLLARINHKGRLRLWRLRDELRADRGREQFGILYDRRAWDRELAVQLPFADQGAPLSLLFIDVDHFKGVNDTLGHGVGDATLIRAMEIVRDLVGVAGDGYRIGGDEFTAALPNTPETDAAKLAEAIRATIEAEFCAMKDRPSEDKSKQLANAPTVSIGVATFTKPLDSKTATEFVDGLVYKAKEAGKNRVQTATHRG